MAFGTILTGYQSRIVALHATAGQLRLGQVIGLALMIVALVVILLLGYLSTVKQALWLPLAITPLPLAMYFGRISRVRNAALLRTLRLKGFLERGVDRLEGRWRNTGSTGEEFARPGHCYLKDLNVTGDGSLFQLLCTCRTEVGRRKLVEYLAETPQLEEILERQESVRELQNLWPIISNICWGVS